MILKEWCVTDTVGWIVFLSEVGHFCIREGGIHINAVGYEPTKIISAHSTKITPFKSLTLVLAVQRSIGP